ncbi:MAG TPA: TIR domain-containing protein [Thermoanaerobaculia bacterium]
MTKPSLFVGSSSEGLEIAEAVQFKLYKSANVRLWNEGLFGLGLGTLEGLVDLLGNYDFAVLVATPDDVTESRGRVAPSPRDNVFVELGMFVGRLGRERAFLLCDDSADLRLPSDLAGTSVPKYSHDFAGTDPISAVGPACTLIKRAIDKLGSLALGSLPYKQLLDQLTDNDVRSLLFLEREHNTRPAAIYQHFDGKAPVDLGGLDKFATRMVKLAQLRLVSMVGGSEVQLSPLGRAFLQSVRNVKEPKYVKLLPES